MHEKKLSSSLDTALAKVNPDRRRFLGMMLTGATALPLLISTELAVSPRAFAKKVEKTAGTAPPAPTFSPAAGTYSAAQTVTISVGTPGVNIYYTTDGSTPTTSSKQYAAAITVSSTETIKAIGNLNGVTSSVGTATYTITGH
jgi:hypothetical protein